MAVLESPDLKIIKDKNGNVRLETMEEHQKRIKKEHKEAYEKEIKEIMDNGGFTRKQAEYICKMRQDFYNAIQPEIY